MNDSYWTGLIKLPVRLVVGIGKIIWWIVRALGAALVIVAGGEIAVGIAAVILLLLSPRQGDTIYPGWRELIISLSAAVVFAAWYYYTLKFLTNKRSRLVDWMSHL